MASIAAGIRTGGRIGSGAKAGDWPVLAGLALLVLLMRGAQFGNPVADFDEQLYSFIGWRMLHGELPFVDWWDRKPFGLFALFALGHAIGGPGPLAYQLPAALATFGGSLLTFHLAKPVAGTGAAAFAAAFQVVLMSLYAGSSGQSETFHVPLMLAMAQLVYDTRHPDVMRRALWAMALGGLALQIKYTVLPQCLLFGAWALWGQYRRGMPADLLAGWAMVFAMLGIGPTATIALFYLAIGEWDAFYFANFVSFFLREGAFTSRFYPRLWLWLLPLVALLACGLVSARFTSPPRDWRRYGFFGLWLLAAGTTVFVPRTIYPYYLAALVPCVVLLATPFFDRRSAWGLLLPLLCLAYVIHLSDLPARYRGSAEARQEIDRFSQAIAPHVDAGGSCLLVFDGPTALYRLTGGCAPSRIVYPDHLNNALETNALDVSQSGELARILATGPSVIVTADKPVIRQNLRSHALLREALKSDYRPLARMALHKRKVFAWVRRGR